MKTMVHPLVKTSLPSSFMLSSMLGFFISVFYVWNIDKPFGFSFALVFAIMFIAAVYNFTHTPDEDDLAVHEPHRNFKRNKAYQK